MEGGNLDYFHYDVLPLSHTLFSDACMDIYNFKLIQSAHLTAFVSSVQIQVNICLLYAFKINYPLYSIVCPPSIYYSAHIGLQQSPVHCIVRKPMNLCKHIFLLVPGPWFNLVTDQLYTGYFSLEIFVLTFPTGY